LGCGQDQVSGREKKRARERNRERERRERESIISLTLVCCLFFRMQNHSPLSQWPEKSFLREIYQLVSREGIKSLFLGMNATLLRESVYSTIRMGAYEPILNGINYQKKDIPSPSMKFLASLISGGIGAVLANPMDLLKVSFQSVLPHQSLPYTSTLEGFRYISKHQGIFGLWKGSGPTVARAAVVTSSVIGSYDTIKNNILKGYFQFEEGLPLQTVCSLLAGIITTLTSNPSQTI
jgi:hypothetical protein